MHLLFYTYLLQYEKKKKQTDPFVNQVNSLELTIKPQIKKNMYMYVHIV